MMILNQLQLPLKHNGREYNAVLINTAFKEQIFEYD